MTALLILLLACGEPQNSAQPAAAPRPKPPEAVASHWIERTDLELDRALRETCAASVEDHKPILLEFSAPWCVDCRRLDELAKTESVKAELTRFHHLTIDVGHWDRHKPLVEAFEVSALAWWVVMQPDECGYAPTRWKRLKEGGFEPASTGTGARTADGVVAWLSDARGASATPE